MNITEIVLKGLKNCQPKEIENNLFRIGFEGLKFQTPESYKEGEIFECDLWLMYNYEYHPLSTPILYPIMPYILLVFKDGESMEGFEIDIEKIIEIL